MWKDFYTKLWFEGTWKDPHGIKAICCTTCEKTFTQSCGLKIHGKTHTGEKSFASTTCEKTFAQSCGLKIYGRNSCVCLYMTLQFVLIDKGPFTYHCRKMAVFLCVSLHDTSGGSDWQRSCHMSCRKMAVCVCVSVCVSLHDTNGGSNGQRSFHNCVAGKWPFFCVCLLVTLQIILF